MSDMISYLRGRGITPATITRFRIEQAVYDNRPCLKYPTIKAGGGAAYRVKFIDGERPKVKWYGEVEQSEYAYYSPGGLVDAIKRCGGVLHWVSGEPDVWTMHEAGFDNVTCCFGERSIPQSLADDLKSFGVKSVVYWPDLDDTGMASAWKFANRLVGSGLQFEARLVPGEMGSKRDLNQFLQDSKSTAAFRTALQTVKVLSYNDLSPYAQPERTPAPRISSISDTEYASMFHEWIDAVIMAIGQPAIREGRIDRWHCPLPSHPDKNPSFRIADGDNCKMPVCTCGIQTRHDKPSDVWDEIARAVHADTWDEYKTRKRAERGALPPRNTPDGKQMDSPAPVEHTPEEPLFMSSTEAYDLIGNQLAGESISEMDFIINPLSVLHGFGGFAHIMFPGKLVYIVGISGGGKTSLAETMSGTIRRQGIDLIWYGPEWTPEEMAMRDLQRGGGVPMIRLAEHKIAVMQERRGVDSTRIIGNKLSNAAALQSLKVINSMLDWTGKAYFTTPRMNRLPLTQMLESAGAFVDARRADGRTVSAFFFDYLQRANKGGRDGAFWSEAVAGEIKAFCEEKQLVGFVMIQPRKLDSQRVHDGSDDLDASSGQGISDQQCNLYLAVAPIFDGDEAPQFARIKIVKNSMGTCGDITVPIDFSRLSWIDKRTRTQTISLNGNGIHKLEHEKGAI